MDRKIIDLNDAPEVLQKAVEKKLNRHKKDTYLLQVFHTTHRYVAYLTVGNLCIVLSLWNFDMNTVKEDSLTVGDIEVFRTHPTMKVWFS